MKKILIFAYLFITAFFCSSVVATEAGWTCGLGLACTYYDPSDPANQRDCLYESGSIAFCGKWSLSLMYSSHTFTFPSETTGPHTCTISFTETDFGYYDGLQLNENEDVYVNDVYIGTTKDPACNSGTCCWDCGDYTSTLSVSNINLAYQNTLHLKAYASHAVTAISLTCTPSCECTSGSCCDGCHYRPSGYTCGVQDCSTQNYYTQTGTESPYQTEYCYYRAYDNQNMACTGASDSCPAAQCTTYTETEKYQCGTCAYIPNSECTGTIQGQCAYYPSITQGPTADGCYSNKYRDYHCTGTSSAETYDLAGTDNDGDGFDVQCGDCVDTNSRVYPGAIETCDGLDNNCDGRTDEGGICGPSISGIPSKTIRQYSGLNDNLVDLFNYATDPDTALSALTFSITSQTNTAVVNCAIDSNRFVDCTTQQGYGYSDITVQVSDGASSAATTFRVTVSQVTFAPVVDITHPDSAHNNFVVGFDVNLMASVTDADSTSLTYSLDWGDGNTANGAVVSDKVNDRHAYANTGTYTITLSASDGTSTASDDVDVKIWRYAFNIINLHSYNNSDFTVEEDTFYRNDPLYLKFKVIHKDAGFAVANNINYVYIYNKASPSSIYDLTAYSGTANGITISNGQPANPNGEYYYYMPHLPLSDDILGWNIVFVFSHNGTYAGQAELEIRVLNNLLQLAQIPDITLDKVNTTHMYYDLDLSAYVSDIETPDSQIKWTFSGMINTIVSMISSTVARFAAPLGWQGYETITATADDNDGSTASTIFRVSSGSPVVNVTAPKCGEIIFAPTIIKWTATDPQNDAIPYVNIQYSPDNGLTWHTIASGISNSGSYAWNTTGLAQGSQYLVKVTAYDSHNAPGYDTTDCPFTIMSSVDGEFTTQIVADKQAAEAPVEVTFSTINTGGNAPFTYAWDFDSDGDTDSTDETPTVLFEKKKDYIISVIVTDYDGDIAKDTYLFNARGLRSVNPRKEIALNRITILNDKVKPGEDLIVTVNLGNKGNYNIEDLSVAVIVQDLDMRHKYSHIDIDSDGTVSKTFVMEVPEDAEVGEYEVLVTIYDDGLVRKRYRPIEVV